MNHLSSHGALMDPDYLRQTQSKYATQGKADAVQHVALALAFLAPAVLWIASRMTGL